MIAAICYDASRKLSARASIFLAERRSPMSGTREPITRRSLALDGRTSRAVAYRLRFKTPDPLLLINCTVWLAPRTTMWITPVIEYSLL